MTNPKLWKTWKVSEILLRRARSALPEPPALEKDNFKQFDESFEEYLDHNEHEMALDMLEEMGGLCETRGGYWRDLERTAMNMGLDDRIAHFRSEFNKALDRSL
ncbi:MAG: hypothetical protein AAGD11_18380 [Planctomycetota bacterium]